MAGFTPYEQKLIDELAEAAREIEVLTQERDNALLLIEELEDRVGELEVDIHHAYLHASEARNAEQYVRDREARGGVHPNA